MPGNAPAAESESPASDRPAAAGRVENEGWFLVMRVVTPAPRAAWRAVLAGDPAALPDHAPEWTDALVSMGSYDDASRLYELDDGRRFLLPMVRRRGAGAWAGWYASFPPAWGIGGLCGRGVDAGVARAVMADLRCLGGVRITLRPDPTQAAAWAALRGPGVSVIPRRAHVIDLSGGIEGVRARMSRSALRGIRTAEKRGVHIERDVGGNLLPVYRELYLSSLERWARQQHEPLRLARWRADRRDSAAKMQRLCERMGDAFRLHVAYVGDRPAAASIMLLGNTAHDTRGAMDRDVAARPRANELLQWTTIVQACEAGCTAYHLGESGNSTSLATFKERFGARPVDYLEFRIERLPFTHADTVVRSGVKRLIGFRDAS